MYWKKLEKVENDVNCKLRVVNNWLNELKLLLNAEKTVCGIFTTYNNTKPNTFNLSIENTKIKIVIEAKFFGIIVDSNLRWYTHVNNFSKYIIRKLSKILISKQIIQI